LTSCCRAAAYAFESSPSAGIFTKWRIAVVRVAVGERQLDRLDDPVQYAGELWPRP